MTNKDEPIQLSTQAKGDIAVAKIILDLTLKQYSVFRPVVNEVLPFDLIAYKDNNIYRIQCKYCEHRLIKSWTSWHNSKGNQGKKYSQDAFDYYGLYLPQIDKVVYPSISFAGKYITCELPKEHFEGDFSCWWYEDFLTFTNVATKKSAKKLIGEGKH